MINTKLQERIKEASKSFAKLCSSCNDIRVENACVLSLVSQENISEQLYSLPYGYKIKNIGSSPIENIQTAVYNSKEGKSKSINLKPDESIILSTKWLILLLHRLEYNLHTKNGYFIPTVITEPKINIDDYFSKFIFSNIDSTSKLIIGSQLIIDNKINILNEYKKEFGYLNGEIKKTTKTKIESVSAEFLGFLINKK